MTKIKIKVVIWMKDSTSASDAMSLLSNNISIESTREINSLDVLKKSILNYDFNLLIMESEFIDEEDMEFLSNIKNRHFDIIFINSETNYTTEVLNMGAIYYISLPISEKQLNEGIKKTVQKQNVIDRTKVNYKIALRTLTEIIYVNPMDILYLKSEENYTHIYLVNKSKITISKTLKYFSNVLPKFLFVRPHQSYILNKKHINKYLLEGVIILDYGQKIPVARNKKEEIKNIIIRSDYRGV